WLEGSPPHPPSAGRRDLPHASVDVRFRDLGASVEKAKVAAFRSLGDLPLVELRVAAAIATLPRLPFGTASLERFLGYIEVDTALRDVDLDEVSVAHQGQWPA